jgi:flagellar hook protein FlgE
MSALQSGVSGMLAHQTRMDTIGNNIANSNTIGFKGSRVEFGDTMSEFMRGGTAASGTLGGINPTQVGMGVYVSGTQTDWAQGNSQATGRTNDVAVQGQGMLAVTDGTSIFYSRDGGLGLDAGGNLVQLSTGLRVVTMPPADAAGTPVSVSPSSTLQVPLGQSLARATSSVELGGNLDSRAVAGTTYPLTTQVFDSLGNSHDVTLKFTRASGGSAWTVSGSAADGAVTIPAPAQVTFDSSGQPTVKSLAVQMTLTKPNGAAAALNLAVSTANLSQDGQVSSVALRSQDGMPPGVLTGVTFDPDGSVQGAYSNGLTSKLGQITTATFANPAGLETRGSNLYSVSANSGSPMYGAPGSDGHGELASGELEGSNVNLTQEFADMIITQRGYQASSRLVTTADQMIQELMSLGR